MLEEVAELKCSITELKKILNNKSLGDSENLNLGGKIHNINDFLGKQRVWIMEKFRACSTGALNHSTVETHLKDYPGLIMALLPSSSIIPQNQEYRIVNKHNNEMLLAGGAVITYEKTAPSTNYPKYADIWTFEHVLQPKKEIYSKPKDKLFKVADITPGQLGFNLTRCNNCGGDACGLTIDWETNFSPCEYRIDFTTGHIKRVIYAIRRAQGFVQIDNNQPPNIVIPAGNCVIVKKADFYCSKPYNVKGSMPTGHCSHGSGCTCGQHLNNVKELIQAGFDRITRIS